MKQQSSLHSFEELMGEALETSLEESYANYGGTNAIGTVQGGSKDKYTPATVLKAPPLRHRNPDISMGQSDDSMKSPTPMIYPFESIFAELVELYSRLETITRTIDNASEMSTISDVKQKQIKRSVDTLARVKEEMRKVINEIEEVTV